MILGLAVHTVAAVEDWFKEKFHVLPFFLYIPYVALTGAGPGIGSIAVIFAGMLGWHQNYLRPGDLLLLASYSLTLPSLQTVFTLTAVTGLYLALFKHMDREDDWIPFAPAILLAYIAQALI